MGNKKGPSLIPQSKGPTARKFIREDATIMEGWNKAGEQAHVLVSLRFVQNKHECFSVWSKDEMEAFWNFNRKIHEYTWAQLLATSGKDNKNGFAYTVVDGDKLPTKDFRDTLGADTTYIELRVTQKIRVHGFRYKPVFYICWLDKDHAIFPE